MSTLAERMAMDPAAIVWDEEPTPEGTVDDGPRDDGETPGPGDVPSAQEHREPQVRVS